MIHLHVDADDLWVYETEYGVAARRGAASVYAEALPRFLELFQEVGAKATFFVVGRDLARSDAQAFCRAAVDAGHEIANHTQTHSTTFHAMSRHDKATEIDEAHETITATTGVAPVGFRAPGYFLDRDIVDALGERGYVYDSSILPSYVQPLMKLYIRAASRHSVDKTFGTPYSALASRGLRRLEARGSGPRSVYELPISVLPVLRLPIHSTFGFRLPAPLRRAAYASLGRARSGVYLFHAVDTLATPHDDVLSRRVIPLRLPIESRIARVREVLAALGRQATMTTAAYLSNVAPESVPRSRLLSRAL